MARTDCIILTWPLSTTKDYVIIATHLTNYNYRVISHNSTAPWLFADYLATCMVSCWLPGSLLALWLIAAFLVPCWLPDSLLAPQQPGFLLAPWLLAGFLTQCYLSNTLLTPWCIAGSLAPCWLPSSLAPLAAQLLADNGLRVRLRDKG